MECPRVALLWFVSRLDNKINSMEVKFVSKFIINITEKGSYSHGTQICIP